MTLEYKSVMTGEENISSLTQLNSKYMISDMHWVDGGDGLADGTHLEFVSKAKNICWEVHFVVCFKFLLSQVGFAVL